MYAFINRDARSVSTLWEVEGGDITIIFSRKKRQGAMPTITPRRRQKDKDGNYKQGRMQARGVTILGTKGNIRRTIQILNIALEHFGDLEKIAENQSLKISGKDKLGQPYFHIKHHVRVTVLEGGKGITLRKYRNPGENNYLHLGVTLRIESPRDLETLILIFESMLS